MSDQDTTESGTAPKKQKRGFALLSQEKRDEIASMGGKAAHARGRAHEFTTEEARAAGLRRAELARAKK